MIITNLRMNRILHNKSQRELADLLDISPTYIHMIETKKATPGRDTAQRIENIFNEPISHLLKVAEKGELEIEI